MYRFAVIIPARAETPDMPWRKPYSIPREIYAGFRDTAELAMEAALGHEFIFPGALVTITDNEGVIVQSGEVA